MRGALGQRGAESLAHVDERVDEHHDLQPAHRLQRPPRVVDAAEERQGQHDEGEQVRHLLRGDLGSEHQAEGGGHPPGERGQREQRQPVDVQVHRRRRDDVGDREHEQGGEQRVEHPRDDLLHADRLRRQRGEDAVLDLLRVAELLDQGQSDGLDPLEHDRQPDHPGDERAGERRLAGPASNALADLREDVGEHEHQQQRLHRGADDEQRKALQQHVQIPLEQGGERLAIGDAGRAQLDQTAPRRGGRRRCVDDGCHSRRSFPVRLMKTVSSVGSLTDRSVMRTSICSAAARIRGSRPEPVADSSTSPSTSL